MQDPLEEFVVGLLKAKGEPDTPESRSYLLTSVNDAVDQALIEALPLAQLDKLEEAANNGTFNETMMEQLLNEAGKSPDDIMRRALNKFQDDYLKGAEHGE